MREQAVSHEPDGARADDVVEVERLDVRFSAPGREAHALRGVDLRIRRGEVVALVGESGSGKSTLGLAIQGLLPQDGVPKVSGSIRVGGVELVGAPQPSHDGFVEPG